ncbi:MAG: HlyD family efflux transporter periplasmic adaptor subunit, partial [Ottowia sp.]|nr:HlyD family efflux transporter periplasmic adaptor subunit [Ottowia sp.]
VTTVGQVVTPGMDLAEIVPVDDTLLVEADIRPADVAFLYPGQPATVKFTAYDYTLYGALTGKLESISADTIADKDGNPFYRITVRTDRNYLADRGKKLPIIPGMIARVDVLTGKKTVLSYLLKPINRVRYDALRER